MRLHDSLRLSLRIFTTRPKRTFLTVLGVGIGIAAVLFLVSVGYGIQKVIIGTISTADSLLSLDVAPGTSGLITLQQETIDSFSHLPNVVEVSRTKNITAQLGLDDLTSDSVVRAIDPSFFRLNGVVVNDGTLFTDPNAREAVVSSATAKLFGLAENDIIGKQITITAFVPSESTDTSDQQVDTIAIAEPYTVRGVLNDDVSSFMYVPMATLGAVRMSSYDVVKVKVASKDVAESVREEIIRQGFLVSSLSDVIDQANQIFRIVQIVLASLGLIALVVSAIGMFNTMTIALLERTNEIGIMRSIGVTRADVQKLFLTEAMVMGMLGGVGGVLMGIGAGELINAAFNLIARRLGGTAVDLFVVPWWFVAVIIGFSTFIGFLTGVFPALRAAKMDPLEALRYK